MSFGRSSVITAVSVEAAFAFRRVYYVKQFSRVIFSLAANWYYGEAEPIDPPLCGNSSGAG